MLKGCTLVLKDYIVMVKSHTLKLKDRIIVLTAPTLMVKYHTLVLKGLIKTTGCYKILLTILDEGFTTSERF